MKKEQAAIDREEARYFIDHYYQVQKHRIAMTLQIKQREKDGKESAVIVEYRDRMHEIEKGIAKYLTRVLKEHPMGDWLIDVKGIGPVLGAALVSFIDIDRADHASSVWKFCGLSVDPETGRSDRLKKGVKCSYSPFMKTICWKVGESFVKSKGRYREVYDTSRVFYRDKFPERIEEVKDDKGGKRVKYNDGHIHAMSKRRAVKLFLSHFWEEWREREGLEVGVPFAHRGEEAKQ